MVCGGGGERVVSNGLLQEGGLAYACGCVYARVYPYFLTACIYA